MINTAFHQSKTQIDDDWVVIQAAQDDPGAFEPIYNKYYEQVLRFVYQRMDKKEEAYDVTSQVFLKALKNLNKYEFRGLPFSSWLFRIAINEMNAFFRKNNKYRTVNIDSAGLHLMMDIQDERYCDEDKAYLVECLTRLSSADYLMIEMRFFEERPFKEIAEILDISENNAKVKTYRALDRLRKIFKPNR